MLEQAWRDVFQAARRLARRPAVALTAILTLAVAIGANTAVFSVVDAVLLRPLPVRDLDRLVALLAGADSIRDAIAFPKSATGADPLTGAPAGVDDRQVRDLHLVSTAPPPVQAQQASSAPESAGESEG